MNSMNSGSWTAIVDWRLLDAAVTIATDDAATPIQTWATNTEGLDDEARLLAVITDGATHGWHLTPQGDDQRPEFIATPLDWQVILTEVSNRRGSLQQGLAMFDEAWQDCIVQASRDGKIPAATVAKTVGITRGRVYQILNDPAHKEP